MTRLLISAALIAAACGSKHRDTAPCDQLGAMVDRIYAGLMKDVAPGMTAHEQQRAADVSAKVAPAMKDAIIGSCRADAWTPEIVRCMAAAADESALDDCEAKLTTDQRKRIEAAMGEVTSQIAPPDDEPAEDTDGELGLGESGLAECDVYAHALERYLDCDEISESVKDSARAGLAQLRRTWPLLRDPATPATAKQAAATACVDAQRELDLSAKAQGCGAHVDAGAASAAAASCTVLGPMIRGILAEQLRSVPADKQAAAEAQSKQLAAPLEQSLIATCERGRWSASAIACFGAARTAQALVACEAQLTPEQSNLLAQAMQDATTKIAGSQGPASRSPPPATRIPECDDYLAAVNAMISCDKLPAEDRARMQRSTALVVEGLRRLADPSLPASARNDAAETCAKALTAAKQLAAHLGC